MVLKTTKQENAQVIQNTISQVLKNDLPTLLENLFDELVPDDEIIRIDILQIDLGIISLQNIKQSFTEHFLQEIRREIIIKKQNSANGDEVKIIHKQQSVREAFLYFLETGTKPWFAAATYVKDWEAEMHQQFTKQDWQSITAWLQRKNQQKNIVIKRLISQFSDNFLAELFNQILPAEDDDWLLIYKDLFALFISLSSNKKSDKIRLEIWNDCLSYYVNNHQNKSKIVEHIVKKLIVQSHVSTAHFIRLYANEGSNIIQTSIVKNIVEQRIHEINSVAGT